MFKKWGDRNGQKKSGAMDGQNDPEAYGFWKNTLRPALGRSVKKTKEVVPVLKACARSPFFGFKCKHSAIKKIARQMGKYQNVTGASITFGFLYDLSKDHKRKILRQRRTGLSK